MWFLPVLVAVCVLHIPKLITAAIADGWDYSLGLGVHEWTSNARSTGQMDFLLYGAVLEYSYDTRTISDEELFGIAHQAYNEMRKLHEDTRNRCVPDDNNKENFPNVPAGLSVLAWDNRIYMASTARGLRSRLRYYHAMPNDYITQNLNECLQSLQADALFDGLSPEQTHKNEAVCAEMYATQMFVDGNTQHRSPSDFPKDASHRIATWGTYGRPGDKPELGGFAMQPCHAKEGHPTLDWGCNEFMDVQGINTMDSTQKRYWQFLRGMPDLSGDPDRWPVPPRLDPNKRHTQSHGAAPNIETVDPVEAPVVRGS